MWASKIAGASPPQPVTLLLAFTNYYAAADAPQAAANLSASGIM